MKSENGSPVGLHLICRAGMALIAGAFLYFAYKANTDLAVGRFALFMDERITFDGVRAIHQAPSVSAFVYAVMDGDDQRYGRILWNMMALVSALPVVTAGEVGQIVTGRMFQAVTLVAASLIFAFGLLKSWPLRLLVVGVTLSLPFAAYFASLPKPEPIMLLAMALFATFYVRQELRFGWYWIFAGIAFGAKIAILPSLIILAGATILVDWRFRQSGTLLRDGTGALTAFLAGFALGVPILMPAVAVFVVLSLAIEKIGVFRIVPEWARLLLRVAILAACIYFAQASFHDWLQWTFLNSGHGADSDQVNLFRWLEFFINDWIQAPAAAGAALLAGILGWLAWLLWRAATRKTIDARQFAGLAIAFAGLALNAAIFIAVKRLWGMYLYPGSVLMVVGVLLLVDHQLSIRLAGARAWLRAAYGVGLAAALSLFATLYWAPRTLAEFDGLSRRTDSVEFRQELASYREVVVFLQSLPPGLPQIEIIHSPMLFPPDPSPTYRIREFWGPFIEWDKAPPVIVFHVVDTPRGPEILPGSANYQAFRIGREGYARHVSSGAGCQAQPCYRVERHLPNGGEVLVRESPR